LPFLSNTPVFFLIAGALHNLNLSMPLAPLPAL
jgi:hypothetical protein